MIKWIVGYIDGYGKVHYKVVKSNDPIDSHNLIWPGPKHSKWRWVPSQPNYINKYGEELNPEYEDVIWNVIDKFKV